jgi:hypothetical protein
LAGFFQTLAAAHIVRPGVMQPQKGVNLPPQQKGEQRKGVSH